MEQMKDQQRPHPLVTMAIHPIFVESLSLEQNCGPTCPAPTYTLEPRCYRCEHLLLFFALNDSKLNMFVLCSLSNKPNNLEGISLSSGNL